MNNRVNINKWIFFKPHKELILVCATLIWVWIIYYLDQNVYGNNIIFQLIPSLFITTLGICVCFPVFWIVKHKQEGFKGIGITTNRLATSILFSVILACWRGRELFNYIHNEGFINALLFNALSIWEVMFIFGWMFTRYRKSFGKIPACILTALSVGVYHCGSLLPENIIYLIVCIFVCGIFYSITDNIFTLWPIYWAVGCTASTMRSNMIFSNEMIILAVILLIIQIICIIFITKSSIKKKNINNY